MYVDRASFDPGLLLVSTLGVTSTLALILTVPRPHVVRPLGIGERDAIAAHLLVGALFVAVLTGQPLGAMVPAGLAAVLAWTIRWKWPQLSSVGVIHATLPPLALLWGTPWTWLLLGEQGFPAWLRTWVLAGAALTLATGLAWQFAASLVYEAWSTHARWHRPYAALTEGAGSGSPKVSIHVPCYAEPPDVVIRTLQRLADLRYSNYEVIVCDNNTPDEALWRPVQEYCERVGFRFYHVAPLKGAKAGALNYTLERTAADADLIAVIDADYLAEPDFLCRLTGFFSDARVGFVQSPHDYVPDGSVYQDMCYWEYMPPNKLMYAGFNEYDCAFTIGTMCILRKDAVRAAGGWAEWCLTEDSEISVRIRALGYQGIYVTETFGRGLIPETYDDLKKQRFRWTAGPVQQLLAHWRLFLPNALGGNPNLHPWVKLMEVHRSLGPALQPLTFWTGLAGWAVATGLTVSGVLPPIDLPPVFWIAVVMGFAAGLARTWHQYHALGVRDVRSMAGAEIAKISLWLVRMTAAAAPLTGRQLAWRRTPKFAADSSTARALVSSAPELAVGAAFALLTLVPVAFRAQLGTDFAVLSVLGFLTCALGSLSAPAMAFLSEARLRNQAPEPVAAAEQVAPPLSTAS